jgi:hypothetical protein
MELEWRLRRTHIWKHSKMFEQDSLLPRVSVWNCPNKINTLKSYCWEMWKFVIFPVMITNLNSVIACIAYKNFLHLSGIFNNLHNPFGAVLWSSFVPFHFVKKNVQILFLFVYFKLRFIVWHVFSIIFAFRVTCGIKFHLFL